LKDAFRLNVADEIVLVRKRGGTGGVDKERWEIGEK